MFVTVTVVSLGLKNIKRSFLLSIIQTENTISFISITTNIGAFHEEHSSIIAVHIHNKI